MTRHPFVSGPQFFQGDNPRKAKWSFYLYTVRNRNPALKLKPRKVGVFSPIPMAADFGVGEFEDEIVEREKLPSYEQSLQDTIHFKWVSAAEVAEFYYSMGNNLSAGVNVLDALHRALGSVKSPYFRGVIGCLIYYIKTVETDLHKAMSYFPEAFDELDVALVGAGESGGVLRNRMLDLAKVKKENLKFVRKVRGAAAYPVSIMTLLFVVTNMIGIFIIPKLMPVFTQMLPTGLPTSTKIVFGVSEAMRTYWWLMPAFLVALGMAWKHRGVVLNSEWYQKMLYRIPFFGKLLMNADALRSLRVLAQLLATQVPVARIYQMVGDVSGNVVLKRYFTAVYQRLRGGDDPHKAFFAERHRIGKIGTDVAQRVRTGETSAGGIPAALNDYLDTLESDLSSLIEKLPNYVNMVMLLVAAPGLVLVALAVIEPSLKMGQDSVVTQQRVEEVSGLPR